MALVRVLKRSCKYVLRLVYGLLLLICSQLKWIRRRVRRWWEYQRIMRSYRFVGKSQAPASILRIPARFLGEIHIVITGIIIAGCTGKMVHLILGMTPDDTDHRKLEVAGLIFYLVMSLISSLCDIGLAVLLIYAAKQNSIDKSLIWYRASLNLLIFFCLISLGFGVMLQTAWILMPIIPNLIFKPFAFWVVGGYIDDLYTINAKRMSSRETKHFYESATADESRPEEGDGDMAGPSRKRTMLYGDDTDSSNANEQHEQDLERRALLLKSGKRESKSEPGLNSSRITASIREGPVVLRQSNCTIAEIEE